MYFQPDKNEGKLAVDKKGKMTVELADSVIKREVSHIF